MRLEKTPARARNLAEEDFIFALKEIERRRETLIKQYPDVGFDDTIYLFKVTQPKFINCQEPSAMRLSHLKNGIITRLREDSTAACYSLAPPPARP